MVDSLVAEGANSIKLSPVPGTFPVVAAARHRGIPIGGHVSSLVSAIGAADSGLNILDHIQSSGDLGSRCLGRRTVQQIPASIERYRPVVERFKQTNTWWGPTIIWDLVGPNHGESATPGPAADVVRDRMYEVRRRFWADSTFLGGWLHGAVTRVGAADSLRFLSIAQQVGLPILAGMDVMLWAPWFDSTWVQRKFLPGFSLHAELAISVTEGLTPAAALRTATLNPAKLLRGTDSLGAVAPGKLADLVLLDANGAKRSVLGGLDGSSPLMPCILAIESGSSGWRMLA